jgi:CRISPR system Cascade subunit CasA
MLFFEEASGGGVAFTRFVAGVGCETPNPLRDPMHPCRADKDLGILPLRFDPDKRTWRSFDSLIPDGTGLAPQTVEHAANLANGNVAATPSAFLVLGLRNEPPSANLEFWRMELFQIPGSLAVRQDLRQQCRTLLDQAETTGKALAAGCASFARALISHGNRPPDPKDIKAALAQLPCLPAYWAALEAAFHGAVQAFRTEQDFYAVQRDWTLAVRKALKEAWGQQRSATQTGSAWALRAMAKAEGPILDEVKRLETAIQEANAYLAEEHP